MERAELRKDADGAKRHDRPAERGGKCAEFGPAQRPLDEQIGRGGERAGSRNAEEPDEDVVPAPEDVGKRQQRPVPEIERITDEPDGNHRRMRQQRAVDKCARASRDQQHRARHGKQRKVAGVVRPLGEEKGGQEHDQQPRDGADVRQGSVSQPDGAGARAERDGSE